MSKQDENHECKARKLQHCIVCGDRIEKGDTQITYSGIEPGEGRFTHHFHPECSKYTDNWTVDDWEGHYSGDISRAEVQAELAKGGQP